jgi:CheY-like chemotaxis protein
MNKDELKLLLVEDEVLIAMLIMRHLESLGYQSCEHVATGQAAIDSVAARQPDIIFMDIRLSGGMDGVEAAQEIHAQYDVPIIFMSGYSTPEIKNRAQAVNPAAILEKPLLPYQIEAAIESTLQGKTRLVK